VALRRALLVGAGIEAPLMLLTITSCLGACRVLHFPLAPWLYVLQLPSTVIVDWLGGQLPNALEPGWVVWGVYCGLVFALQSTLIAMAYGISNRAPRATDRP
jgi:hypothetical protein